VGGETDEHSTGANRAIDDGDVTWDATAGSGSIPPEDDSGTIPPSARNALRLALGSVIRDATIVGDLALARDVAALLIHVLGVSEPSDKP
jgi:hypothetical protein